MRKIGNFEIEGGDYWKDIFSDNMYAGRYRVTYKNIIRDGLQIHYMPDDRGLVIYSTTTNEAYVFDEEGYRFGTYDEEELRRLAHHFKTNTKEAEKLVNAIFEDSFNAEANLC